jgi:hypothetical protein
VSGLLVIDAVGCRSMYFVVMPRVSLTTRKTLIHGPIIYGALRFGAPQISSHGAPCKMRHRYHLICGAPNKGCATHMWAPTSTIAEGVRPPHPWRMTWVCATHIAEISGAPQFYAPQI